MTRPILGRRPALTDPTPQDEQVRKRLEQWAYANPPVNGLARIAEAHFTGYFEAAAASGRRSGYWIVAAAAAVMLAIVLIFAITAR